MCTDKYACVYLQLQLLPAIEQSVRDANGRVLNSTATIQLFIVADGDVLLAF